MGSARRAPTLPPRTAGQNRRLWGLVTELERAGLEREDAEAALREACRAVSGQDSTRQLTAAQADQVIARLAPRAVPAPARHRPSPHDPWGERGPGPREGQSITPRQQQVIQALFLLLGWEEQARQRAFAVRQCGVPWPQTQEHADRLMEPLKAMALRHVRPAEIWHRAQALRGHAGLDAWQRGFMLDLCGQFEAANQGGELGHVLTPHKLAKLLEAEAACGVGQ